MKIAVFYENVKEGAAHSGISLKEAFLTLKEAGAELLYISGDMLEADRETVSGLLEETGLKVEGMHQWLDFGHDPGTEAYRKTIDDARMLGADNVLLIPGFIFPGEEENADRLKAYMVEGMRQAVEYGKRCGIRVCMEDFDGMQVPFNSVAGLKMFLDQISELYCCFDTGNFVMHHEDELEAFRQFHSRICTVHLKDRGVKPYYPGDRPKVCADGAEVYPCPVGYGTIAMKEIIAGLKEMDYRGNVIVEMYDCDPAHMLEGIRKSVMWLQENL